MKKNIYVTQPSLPPLDEFTPFLQDIWESKNLTNGGDFHKRLEAELKDYLEVGNVSLFSNGTIALMVALKALGLDGEVITTPFSFVATSHAIVWCGLTPVFVDIDPNDLNIDPSKIEEAITEKTVAILAVHCYGTPCKYDEIDKIAKKYNLKVIYDAAHAFGVEDDFGSILSHGDLSILSFHATKVFNTFEGGAIISSKLEVKERIDQLKNFGFKNEVEIDSVGINGKMSEFNAAFGLLQLRYVDEEISKRAKVDNSYRNLLGGVKGIKMPLHLRSYSSNYSYFPILVTEEYPITRDELYEHLKKSDIYTRRYFYPLISNFRSYNELPSSSADNLPISNHLASEVLCLPIYGNLEQEVIQKICCIISEVGR